MNTELVKKIADAMLYEGYILYPYRASTFKNRQRFNFGVITPEAYSTAQRGTEACRMQTECLVVGDHRTAIDVKVRFLHLMTREVGQIIAPSQAQTEDESPQFRTVPSLEIGGKIHHTWQEAIERESDITDITIESLLAGPRRMYFMFPEKQETENLYDEQGHLAGVIYRNRQPVKISIETKTESITDHVFKITIEIKNLTAFDDAQSKSRDEALMQSLVSTHTILTLCDGQFVSLLDPPKELAQAVSACSNIGTFPVLVGNADERDTMLSSPIILYDYPQIAEESAGDLFDGTEIDEILTLRILTMTDEEKRQMRNLDEHARRILERTESMPSEQLMKMHGTMRGLRPVEGNHK